MLNALSVHNVISTIKGMVANACLYSIIKSMFTAVHIHLLPGFQIIITHSPVQGEHVLSNVTVRLL